MKYGPGEMGPYYGGKKMNIDYKKIADLTGLHFESAVDMLCYLQSQIGYLATHNKNLTNKQYSAVRDIESILNGITPE